MYLSKRGFHNRSCAKFDTVAMVFRKNENCEAGIYKKKKSHEHGLQIYIYIYIHTRKVRIKKKEKKEEEEEEIMPCYLTEKEEKKISCLLQDFLLFFLRSPNLCTLRGKL